jgi:regulator of protease activity HflC (stomatin/prohibitin superfamily)
MQGLTILYKGNMIRIAHKVKNMEKKKTEGEKEAKKEKKTEEVEGKIKFWRRITFWTWMLMAAVIALIAPIAIRNFLPEISWLPLIGEVLTLLGLGLWLKKCLRVVGAEIPSQAVLTRFVRPVDALPIGLCFIFRPFENLIEYPTGLYTLRYRISSGLYSKEEKDLASQPMEVEVNVYFRFPRLELVYTFPYRTKEGSIQSKRVSGKELLMTRTYYRFPFKNLKETKIEDIGKFLEGAVMGAVRAAMSKRNYVDCREKQEEIASEIKEYLFLTEGNPFFECGIPKECVDVEIIKVKFPDEMEKKFYEPEMKRKEAEAAEAEKERINKVTAAYINQGIPPEIAGMLTGGVTGKAMTFEQLRDLAIFQALGGFRKREISKNDIIETLQKLPPEELKKLLERILKHGG